MNQNPKRHPLAPPRVNDLTHRGSVGGTVNPEVPQPALPPAGIEVVNPVDGQIITPPSDDTGAPSKS